MPDKPDEEIRKSIKRFEESLPESERNPDAQRLAHQRRRRRPLHARVNPLREFAYEVQHGQATAGGPIDQERRLGRA